MLGGRFIVSSNQDSGGRVVQLEVLEWWRPLLLLLHHQVLVLKSSCTEALTSRSPRVKKSSCTRRVLVPRRELVSSSLVANSCRRVLVSYSCCRGQAARWPCLQQPPLDLRGSNAIAPSAVGPRRVVPLLVECQQLVMQPIPSVVAEHQARWPPLDLRERSSRRALCHGAELLSVSAAPS